MTLNQIVQEYSNEFSNAKQSQKRKFNEILENFRLEIQKARNNLKIIKAGANSMGGTLNKTPFIGGVIIDSTRISNLIKLANNSFSLYVKDTGLYTFNYDNEELLQQDYELLEKKILMDFSIEF